MLINCGLSELRKVGRKKPQNTAKEYRKMEPIYYILIALILTIALVEGGRWLRQSRLLTEKGKYRDLGEPIWITQDGPDDEDFWERVEVRRERLNQVGNRWQPPIVAVPWDSVFDITVAGETQSFSTVGMGRREYARYAVAVYDVVWQRWQEKVSQAGGMAATMMYVNGQKPPAAPVWNTK